MGDDQEAEKQMMEYYFDVKSLSVGYDGNPLIKDINLRLPKGHIMTLIGPNGAGKSTILKTITRQIPELEGFVYLDGKKSSSIDMNGFSRQVSVMLTQRMTTDMMTCREVVETGRYPYTGRLGILSEEDHREVRRAMTITNTLDLADRDFMRISDGQKQRIMFARAIAQEPELLVLDEPTSFLDVKYKLELLNILRVLAREKNITIIMSLHELDLAERISDEIVCVKGDYITDWGTAWEIFRKEKITDLYDLDTGSYNPIFGSVELKKNAGPPQVFVIAGGGKGVPVFRELQKKGVPFAAGVLHKGDVDELAGRDLAASIVTERPFCSIGDTSFSQAVKIMRTCSSFVNCLDEYGEINSRNRDLAELARKEGIEEIDPADINKKFL